MTLLTEGLSPREQVIVKLAKNRGLAHSVLFEHRHPNITPAFHGEIVRDFHDPSIRYLLEIVFRGGAKSTLAEEAVVIMAALREFNHALIVGASLDKAGERLHAIRRQFEKNERLIELFGELRGQPWGDDKIELSSGITIQAMGRGQAIRGTKNEDYRPDFILADDIEDAESVRTVEGREKVLVWFLKELLPAGDEPNLRVRVLANDMGVDCLANRLSNPSSGFIVRRYPWVYIDGNGNEAPAWPDRYPLSVIAAKKKQMEALGRAEEYQQEYMCRSEVPEAKPFKEAMFRIEPQVRTWQPVYAMFDPARTVHANSATTGYAAWSWIANRLVVWDAWARMLMPDQIIAAIFDTQGEFAPVEIGVEEDGLNQFLLQPIRQEQVKRRVTIPLKPLKAPRGKMDFIRGLQPFFHAREVIFAKALPDLAAQLLSFPTGRIDAPNALAYALKMRPGAPIYEDFTQGHVIEDMRTDTGKSCWLAMNAKPALVTAVLLQLLDGTIRIFADWVREGDPGETVPDILADAALEAGRDLRFAVAPQHFDRYANAGLVQAIKRHRPGADIRKGTEGEPGRNELRTLLRRTVRGAPALVVSAKARWTLNALSGGYCRAVLKAGQLADYAEEGAYRMLMEGVEGFAGLLRSGSPDEDESGINYAYTRDGRRFISARAQK